MESSGKQDEVCSAYLTALEVITQNIANANTTAFKRLQVRFQEVIGRSDQESNADLVTAGRLVGGFQNGHGVKLNLITRNFSMGKLMKTGEPLDVAIQGDGFFEVVLPDGLKAYTRDGAFRAVVDGRLTTAEGLPVAGGFQAIPPGTTSVTIGHDGRISYLTHDGTTSFQVQLCRFDNPAELCALGDNLYQETASSGSPLCGYPGQTGFGDLVQGCLERSNVDLAEELRDLNRLRNAYEAYSTATEMKRKLTARASKNGDGSEFRGRNSGGWGGSAGSF
jgi:flagellar basal-body rod protein FlgG